MEMVMSEFNYARYYVSSANLALVAYRAKGGLDGNVTAGMSSNALSASLISAGLQSSAAQDIASNYSVVDVVADATETAIRSARYGFNDIQYADRKSTRLNSSH